MPTVISYTSQKSIYPMNHIYFPRGEICFNPHPKSCPQLLIAARHLFGKLPPLFKQPTNYTILRGHYSIT